MRHLIAGLLLLTLLAATAGAAERIELENGLTVILHPQRGAPAVAVGAYIRTGRIYEPPHLAGLSHFVEHMMFRATAKRPGGRSEREAWSAGARYRAFTHEDFTRYQIVLPSDRIDLAMDILSDALRTAAFRPEEVEEERAVILDEIAKRDSSPELWAFEELMGLAYLPHPYGERIIGSKETVRRISRDELHDWHRSRYRPERTTLVIVGDVTRKDALERVRRFFGSWRGAGPVGPEPPALLSEFGQYQEMVLHRAGASPLLLVNIGMPSYLHADYMAARFFRESFSGWLQERLIVQKKVAISVDSFFTAMIGRNMLRLRVVLASADKAAAARDAVLELLAEMNRGAWRYAGFESVARNFQSRELLLKENLDRFAEVVGRAAMNGYYAEDGVPERLAADERYSRIGPDDLERIARRYLLPGNIRVVFLLPPGEAPEIPPPDLGPEAEQDGRFPPIGVVERLPTDPEATTGDLSAPPKDSDATRVRLPSGTTLVHLERSSVPVVGGAILFPAGSRHDPPGKEGLAALTLGALEYATRGRGRHEVRWLLYENGSSFGVQTRRDVSRITFTVPRDGHDEMLRAVRDLIYRPEFSPDAIRMARGKLLREIRRNAESVGRFAGAAFRGMVLGTTHDGREENGTEESLGRITREDLVAFHAAHLRPETAVVALVGDVTGRRARLLASELFVARPGRPEPTDPPGPAGPLAAARRELTHASGRGYLMVGTRAPGLTHPDKVGTDLLRLALGWQAFTEFTEVRSNAYEAGAVFGSLSQTGSFGLYVGTAPKNLPESEAVFQMLLADAAGKGIPAELLEDTRGAWLGGAAIASVWSSTVANRLATREITGRGYASFDADTERIRKVTGTELRTLAARLFDPERLVTVVVNAPK